MKRWYLYKNDVRVGQFGSWERALSAIRKDAGVNIMTTEFIAVGYLRVCVEGNTYNIKLESVP